MSFFIRGMRVLRLLFAGRHAHKGKSGNVSCDPFLDKCGFVELFFEIPDGMTQGYDFPEEAVRRGRQVLRFAIPSRRATLNARKSLMLFRLFRATLGP